MVSYVDVVEPTGSVVGFTKERITENVRKYSAKDGLAGNRVVRLTVQLGKARLAIPGGDTHWRPIFSNPAVFWLNQEQRPPGFASPGYPGFAQIGWIMSLHGTMAHSSKISLTIETLPDRGEMPLHQGCRLAALPMN